MARHIEMNPVSHITVGTVGPPGQRVFYLQASKGADLVTLLIEKHQATMISNSCESLLEDIARDHPSQSEAREEILSDMRLREPLDVLFRVGNMGLGYNEALHRVVLVAYELVPEDEEPSVVSFWASRSQVKSLAKHAASIVKAGRPICGNCGQPMDIEGHFCPHRNGHKV